MVKQKKEVLKPFFFNGQYISLIIVFKKNYYSN